MPKHKSRKWWSESSRKVDSLLCDTNFTIEEIADQAGVPIDMVSWKERCLWYDRKSKYHLDHVQQHESRLAFKRAKELLLQGIPYHEAVSGIAKDYIQPLAKFSRRPEVVANREPRTVCIYGLKEPDGDRIEYVGVAVNPLRRLARHYSQPHKALSGWIASIRSQGKKPDLVELEWITTPDIHGADSKWIEKLLAEGHPLRNKNWRYPRQPKQQPPSAAMPLPSAEPARNTA